MSHSAYIRALQDEARDFNAGLLTHAEYAANVRNLIAEQRAYREAEELDRYCDCAGQTFNDADCGL